MRVFLCILASSLLSLIAAMDSYAEKKIKRSEVPQKIRSYLEEKYKGAKSIRYYLDVKGDTSFYEIELRYNKEKLSLTFFQDGSLYELEKKVAFKALPISTRKQILTYLDQHYEQYKISEVQFVNPHLHTEYELSIKAKNKNGSRFYEMYFNESGEILRVDEITVKPIQTLF